MRFNRNDPADCDCIMYDGSAWQSHRDQLLFDGSDLYCVSAGKRAGVLFVEMMVGSVARNSSQRVTVTRPRIEWRFRNRGKRSSHWLELTIDWNDEQLVAVKRRWNEEEVDGPNVERSRNRVGRFTVRSESCVAVDCLRDLLYAIVVLSLFCLPVSGVSVAILPLFPRYWFFFLVFLVFCFVLFLLFGSFMTWHGGHCSIEETAIGVVTAPIVTSPPFQRAINWNRSSYYCHYPRARVTLAVITDWIPPYFCHWYSPLITVMTVYGHFIRLLRFIYYWLNLRDMGAGSQMILYNLNRSQLPLWQLAMIIYSLPIGLNCWKYRVDGSEIETGRCYRHSFRQIQWHLNDISLVNRLYFEFSAGNICFVWISLLLLSLNTVDILVDYDCNWWAGISLSVSRCGVCKLAL